MPASDELVTLIANATAALPPDRIWVNPDCGLKTRREDEVRPALANMVRAAATMRNRLART